MLVDRLATEFFHISVLRLLCSGSDRHCFALKGGCNLRFFFESVRFSEDMDLDVVGMPIHTLKSKVGRLLGGPSLRLPLQSRGITLGAVTVPKQTETTQRWKIELMLTGHSVPLHTKIEFSRRTTLETAEIEPIASSVLAEHKLMSFVAPHYAVEAALRQKVLALVGRTAVQARDVFDLGVLLAHSTDDRRALKPVRAQLPQAVERTMEISYADFKSQVASYLKPEELAVQGSREDWEALQSQVVEKLLVAFS